MRQFLFLAFLLFPFVAMADGRDLATRDIREFPTLTAGNIASGDLVFIYDVSADKVSSLDATTFPNSNVYNTTFSTTQTSNPLMMMTHKNLTVSTDISSTAMTTIIASVAGRSIYPGGGITIMVSGTAATATALALECSDGTLIASWPIADLVDLKPIGMGIYSSVNAVITTGAGLGRGCAASTALMLSNVGTKITTTTQVYVSVPYTLQ